MVKNLPAIVGDVEDMGLAWVGKSPCRRKWHPTPVFLPGEFRGQRTWQAAVHGVTRLKQLSMHAEGLKIQVLMYFPVFKCWQ